MNGFGYLQLELGPLPFTLSWAPFPSWAPLLLLPSVMEQVRAEPTKSQELGGVTHLLAPSVTCHTHHDGGMMLSAAGQL